MGFVKLKDTECKDLSEYVYYLGLYAYFELCVD